MATMAAARAASIVSINGRNDPMQKRCVLVIAVITLLLFTPLVARAVWRMVPIPSAVAESLRLAQAPIDSETQPDIDPEVAQATRTQLLEGVETPPERPEVVRTIIEGDYALATWLWGPAGGQSILIRQGNIWEVMVSGGGAVDQLTLEDHGVPPETARILMTREQATQQP